MLKIFRSVISAANVIPAKLAPAGSRQGAGIQSRFNISLIILLICFSALLHAQEPSKKPHGTDGAETGMIKGRVLQDGKSVMKGHKVTLEIGQGGAIVLSIPKSTDSGGAFTFKNIFKSSEFSYRVVTEFNGEMYGTDIISLHPDQNIVTMDLVVGKGGKPLHQHTAEASEQPGDEHEGHMHAPQYRSLAEYKFLAILLSLGALIYAFYKRKKA